MLGACTLSNVYNSLGFSFVRHITMFFGLIVVILYIFKIMLHKDIAKQEYNSPLTSSLYPAMCMITMVLGAYYYEYFAFGKIIWLIAFILHIIHIIFFTYLHFIKSRDIKTFLPTWFVTYNGIMVSSVVGANMNFDKFLAFIVYYGIIIYFIILPFMIIRLKKVEIKDNMQHSTAILLGPCSLCVVSYINIIKDINLILLIILYICVILSLIYIIIKLPRFFSYKFAPTFASLTFPMAIGIVATQKMELVSENFNYKYLAYLLNQLEGIQIYLTTAIIAFVLFNFIKMIKLEKSY